MKLTCASFYALHALVHLAEHGDNRPMASHAIARARGIPELFLLKVLKPLVSRRILLSLKGPNGGYRLAKPSAKISLLDVIEAAEGPIRGQVSFTAGDRTEKLDRKLQGICDQAAEGTRDRLQAVSVAELVGKGMTRK